MQGSFHLKSLYIWAIFVEGPSFSISKNWRIKPVRVFSFWETGGQITDHLQKYTDIFYKAFCCQSFCWISFIF